MQLLIVSTVQVYRRDVIRHKAIWIPLHHRLLHLWQNHTAIPMCPRRSRPKLLSSSPTVQGAFASGYAPTLYDLPQPNKFQSGVRVGYNPINGEFSHTPMETYT